MTASAPRRSVVSRSAAVGICFPSTKSVDNLPEKQQIISRRQCSQMLRIVNQDVVAREILWAAPAFSEERQQAFR